MGRCFPRWFDRLTVLTVGGQSMFLSLYFRGVEVRGRRRFGLIVCSWSKVGVVVYYRSVYYTLGGVVRKVWYSILRNSMVRRENVK